jgi:hypothetical protein
MLRILTTGDDGSRRIPTPSPAGAINRMMAVHSKPAPPAAPRDGELAADLLQVQRSAAPLADAAFGEGAAVEVSACSGAMFLAATLDRLVAR